MRSPLLCYITDRQAFSGDEGERRHKLLAKIGEAARAGVDYIQLREKDLLPRELETLATDAVRCIRNAQPDTVGRKPGTASLINSRVDVALAVGAKGIHLPANDLRPSEVRGIWNSPAGENRARVTISISCHTREEIDNAESDGADLALYAPIFEKKGAPSSKPVGLDGLRQACRSRIPVLALGGVTVENASACLEAGAAGIAAIRLFQEGNIAELVSRFRS
jgi:thiamine-phosphate pyrophosphorylase